MHNRGALVRRFGKDVYGNLLKTRIISFVSPFADKTSQIRYALRPAQRLNIFAQNLIDGRPPGVRATISSGSGPTYRCTVSRNPVSLWESVVPRWQVQQVTIRFPPKLPRLRP